MKTLILAAVLFAVPSLFAQNANYDFVQVSGQAEVRLKPEYVLVMATVYSRGIQAQAAQKANAREMARIEKILKQDFKIDEKDIQTSNFQVSPQYDYVQNKTIYKGMSVTHSLTIKYRKTDDIGNLLDRVIDAQAQEGFGVRVDSITFGSDQVRQAQAQALESAVADAKARAAVLAKASGRKLKDVRKISDSQAAIQSAPPMKTMKYAMEAMDAGSSTAISPGELTVQSQVQVEIELQ